MTTTKTGDAKKEEQQSAPEDAVRQILAALRQASENKRLQQFIDVIIVAMETAEHVASLTSGSGRAMAVIRALSSDEVMSILPSDEVKEAVRQAVQSGLVRPVLTLVSEAAKKHIDINRADAVKRIKQSFRSCASGCCASCR